MILLLACAAPLDPPEALVGERLFLEPRFAQRFAAEAADPNSPLTAGDPVLDTLPRDGGDVPGPFAGSTMSCRACHLVDDVTANVHEPVRTYADFARRSPIPDRGDGLTETVRNSPSLVDMAIDHDGPAFLHYDGEFTSPEDLVRGSFTGRNLGWLATEHADAVAHIATILREDDGSYPLVADGATLSYTALLSGTDPSIPDHLVLPAELRIDVATATDDELLDGVAALVAAYLRNIQFSRGLESGVHNGSPYDVFLAKNGLPGAPETGESGAAYTERLRAAVEALHEPAWVSDVDQRFGLHDQAFTFGAAELRGLRVFLAAPPAEGTPTSGVGNCAACHAPPVFSDFGLHNTGVSQEAYDAVWGDGAFAALALPSLADREADPAPWLPASPEHPDWAGAARAIPAADRATAADLGAWAIFGNPDHPSAQEGLATLIDSAYSLDATTDTTRLDHAVGLFKTPSVRDLVQSAPYLHDGSAADLDAVLTHYVAVSDAARAGTLRNADPRLAGITLNEADRADLLAFLAALTEDYE